MKYKFDKYIGDHILNSSIWVQKSDMDLLKKCIDEINVYHFPELNGLHFVDIFNQWAINQKEKTYKLYNSLGNVVSIQLIENGYIICGSDEEKLGSFGPPFEDIYLKRCVEYDQDSQDEGVESIVTEMAFYYGDDLIKFTGHFRSLNDYKYEVSIYVDVDHYKFNLSQIEKELEPDFVFTMDSDNNKSNYTFPKWEGIVGTSQVIPYECSLSNTDVVQFRLQCMKIDNACRRDHVKNYNRDEKVYIKS